ncbi:Arylsulfotransferase [Campylobacter jejuni subsp. doylei]|uniref:Arylsulfotransferase n=1 Tax=Campylobacter jejuni subsp. doylei TaxID=32021 RepID=A0A381CVY6_CAMJU|nr:Arylsulfotransferase [Campylobacter jejuni subsp. doylei]VEG61678.1 Arylsulfotransferase [Campylobacter jejuni subsp. doylei]
MNWDNIYNRGIMMGFYQNKDGALTWGFGQRYVKYDVWEEKFSIANYLLPIDFSHAMDNMQNGHYLFSKYFASRW